jgi:hypothetical protein
MTKVHVFSVLTKSNKNGSLIFVLLVIISCYHKNQTYFCIIIIIIIILKTVNKNICMCVM